MLMIDWINFIIYVYFSIVVIKGGWNLWVFYDINEYIGMIVVKNNVGLY